MNLLRPSSRPGAAKTGCSAVMLVLVLLFPLGVENSMYNPREDVRNIEGHDVREARHLFWRGVEHFNAARFGESVDEFRASSRRSNHYEASSLFNMALVFEKSGVHETGDIGDIEGAYMEAVGAEGAEGAVSAASFARLGLISGRNGKYDESLERFQRALQIEAEDNVLVRRNMAVALRLGGKTSEADKIEAAIALEDPMMLGQSLPQSHIMAQAGDIGLPGTGRLDRWMECDLYVTEGGWLDVVLETCQILDGERFLKDGVVEDPTDISAWYQLGVFYRNHDRMWDCARVLSHLLRLRGDYAPAWAVLGGALADNKNYSLSVRPLKNALARNPGDLYARSNLILSLAWTCQWDQNSVHIPVFIEQLSKGLAGDLASFPAPAHMMFIVAGMADSFPLGVYRAWVDKWSAEMTSRVDHTPFLSSYPQYRQGERLRIGYVSGAGFQRSPGSSAIRGIFELHDRGRFEVLCFALKPFLHGNDLRGNISASCDRFVELGDVQDDRDLAWRVNAHKPHVIIDLSGFSGDHRIRMLAHRPAPLSLTFLEYPGTLGAATGIDGIVTDRIASPPEYRLAYSEALLSVPPPYLPNDYRATVPPPSDALAAFPKNQDLTFCALHHVWKMDSEVFSAWMHILSTFPSSTLRLQGCSDDAKESLRAKAQSLGVDPDRLVFNQKLSTYSEHIEKLSKCSLFFDAPRYNAHTSAADALWAGVPVLTLPFQMMVHRGAACLVRSVGLDSAISRNMEDYILIAKAISKSSGSLEMIRSQLRRGRQDKALFDTRGWTLAIERGILMMFESKMLMQVPRAREAVAARSANPTSFHIIPIRGP